MLKRRKLTFKKGAASFYVVAIATLILVIIATSFAAIIISEVSRTSNEDLSQSAYDSALAGIEDSKLAFYNYQACKEQGYSASATKPTGTGPLTCSEIMWYMEHPDCDMVAHILGRLGKDEGSTESGGIVIQESTSADNNLQQAYTCAKITTKLTDYRSTLTESNPTRVVRVKLNGTEAKNIKKVRVGWYSRADGTTYAFTNVAPINNPNKVQFPDLKTGKVATPPTVSVGLVQASNEFNLEEFDRVESGVRSNRALVYLVPTNDATMASSTSATQNYKGIYKDGTNALSKSDLTKSNDRTVKNKPFAVYCPEDSDDVFACSVTMDLPEPIGGDRSDDAFIIVMSIPYGQPSTDFGLEFFCSEGAKCGTVAVGNEEVDTNQATLEGVQVDIDSTGRANDLYRRVEARLDAVDSHSIDSGFAIELLSTDKSGAGVLEKVTGVTREYGNYDESILRGMLAN